MPNTPVTQNPSALYVDYLVSLGIVATLALVQLLILYHVLTAMHRVSLGAGSARDFEPSVLEELLASEEPAPV